MKTEIPNWKKDKVIELAKRINNYPTVAVCHLEGIPTKQLQIIRKNLRGKAKLVVSKKSILKKALSNANNKKIEEIKDEVKGISGLLLSDLDPFELFDILKKNKSDAPAKAGQEAPTDIIVPAGPTPFAPGPVMSQLGAIGIKPKIETGKLTIPTDTKVVKKGETISKPVAEILSRLEIKPMKIGLDFDIVVNNTDIFNKNILDISEEEFFKKIRLACSESFNLSMAAEIVNEVTISHLLRNAEENSKKLILSKGLVWEGETEKLINLANSQANTLENHIRGE